MSEYKNVKKQSKALFEEIETFLETNHNDEERQALVDKIDEHLNEYY
jgi:hypothetical protein